jgi:hypothetical protein
MLRAEAIDLLRRARRFKLNVSQRDAYPANASAETKQFVRYWFDLGVRKELTSLARYLDSGRYETTPFLACAFSRMIITKQGGVSLAEDVSHSRPHRTRDLAPYLPFDLFPSAVEAIIDGANFLGDDSLPAATTLEGDCRALPFESDFFDYAITSPPYLNAIDYLRGHKMSLVWLGHQIEDLRDLRATNVGSNRGLRSDASDEVVRAMLRGRAAPNAITNTLRQYAQDLRSSIAELQRVVRPGGSALFVIGDCTIKGVEVRNSAGLDFVARQVGFERIERYRRELSPNRRYLPPPSAGGGTANRLWDEIILKYRLTG